MGTRALLRGLVVAAMMLPATAAAAREPVAATLPAAVVTGGHDTRSSWLHADYRELQLRARTDRGTRALAITLRVGADIVKVQVAPESVAVARGSRFIVVDSPEALQAVQELLGGSAAIFGLKSMLSDLEPVSRLTAPDMALLSTAAFVAALVGDVGAPQRIADRFMERHRGIYRQARESGKCWSDYSAETSAAWTALEDCMKDADAKDFFRAAYERLACNAVWIMRAESAWFEYLKCLSPLTVIPQ